MNRSSLLLAAVAVAVFTLAGCGNSNSPSVSQVTVTVTVGGTPWADSLVVASAGMADTTPTDVIASQNTNSSGQTTFAVPGATTTGMMCFTSTASSFISQCFSLNNLPPTLPIAH
jgi:hypothetical protein